MDIKAAEKYWRNFQSVKVTKDSIVHPGPCYLITADMTVDAAGAATANIRDGVDNTASVALTLSAVASDHDCRRYIIPIFISKGLFVDISANVTSVLIQFIPYPYRAEKT